MSDITMQEEPGSLSANVQIDDANDIITIYGRKFAGELLRHLQAPSPPGEWFRIIASDEEVTIQRRQTSIVPTQTHTYAALEVTPAVYDEIAQKLRDADYHHAFDEQTGAIDMHGIGLVRAP